LYATSASINAFSASMLSFTASQKNSNGTYATTGSNTFRGNQVISGSLTVSGSTDIYGTANVTGSVNVSGSTGTAITANIDTITFTGSFNQSGSVSLTGSVDLTGFPLTASFIRLNGGNGASNEDNFHQIRFDYRYDSGSRALGAGGFSHFLTSRHFPGANSNNNALDIYLNNSVGQYSSTAWNTGSTLGVTITATGIGVLKTNPNTALDVSGNLLVTGSIISTASPILSSSQQITNYGFATTSSLSSLNDNINNSYTALSNRLDLPVYLSLDYFINVF
jgi:hypothetical protein